MSSTGRCTRSLPRTAICSTCSDSLAPHLIANCTLGVQHVVSPLRKPNISIQSVSVNFMRNNKWREKLKRRGSGPPKEQKSTPMITTKKRKNKKKWSTKRSPKKLLLTNSKNKPKMWIKTKKATKLRKKIKMLSKKLIVHSLTNWQISLQIK